MPALFAASLLALFLPLELTGKTENALEIGGFVGVVVGLLFMSYGTIEQLSDYRMKRRPVFWFYMHQKPILENREIGDLKARTLFRNLSRIPIKMYVDLQPSIHGRLASCASLGPKYTGADFVLLGPEDNMNGNFSISRLLAENGISVQDMKAEAAPDNRTAQLRLSIRIRCEDKDGNKYVEAEEIAYYFDFERGDAGVWVYDG